MFNQFLIHSNDNFLWHYNKLKSIIIYHNFSKNLLYYLIISYFFLYSIIIYFNRLYIFLSKTSKSEMSCHSLVRLNTKF